MLPFSQIAAPRTLADVVLGRQRAQHNQATSVFLVVLFSLLVAVCAQASIRLPFTPVPITGQTFAVLLTGALLGSRRGALALLVYLLEGALGLPVFAEGRGGVGHLIGPTGGYLVAFPLAAGVVGLLAERGWDRTPLRTALAMLLGSLVVFTLGVCWLSRFVGGVPNAVVQGMLPFLPGDLIKTALAALLLPGGWKLVGEGGQRKVQ